MVGYYNIILTCGRLFGLGTVHILLAVAAADFGKSIIITGNLQV